MRQWSTWSTILLGREDRMTPVSPLRAGAGVVRAMAKRMQVDDRRPPSVERWPAYITMRLA